MTFAELDSCSNIAANELVRHGVGVGDCVMLCVERSIHMIIAITSILNAGACYVPVDEDYPVGRIETMISDTGSTILVVGALDNDMHEKFVASGIMSDNILSITDLAAKRPCIERPTLSRLVQEADVVCCIFTSGSTGQPKGVQIRHKQLRLSMRSFQAYAETAPSDRFLLSSALVFDASFIAIFGTIIQGATMVIASKEGNLWR